MEAVKAAKSEVKPKLTRAEITAHQERMAAEGMSTMCSVHVTNSVRPLSNWPPWRVVERFLLIRPCKIRRAWGTAKRDPCPSCQALANIVLQYTTLCKGSKCRSTLSNTSTTTSATCRGDSKQDVKILFVSGGGKEEGRANCDRSSFGRKLEPAGHGRRSSQRGGSYRSAQVSRTNGEMVRAPWFSLKFEVKRHSFRVTKLRCVRANLHRFFFLFSAWRRLTWTDTPRGGWRLLSPRSRKRTFQFSRLRIQTWDCLNWNKCWRRTGWSHPRIQWIKGIQLSTPSEKKQVRRTGYWVRSETRWFPPEMTRISQSLGLYQKIPGRRVCSWWNLHKF